MKIKDKIGQLKGQYVIKTYKAGTKELLRQSAPIKNLIVLNTNNGLYIIFSRLLNVLTYDLPITQAKIGDGTTPPAIAQTDLINTIVDGIPVALRSRVADDEIMITFFISDADLPNGTYKEFGIFCTDQLFARSLITPNYTKATGEDSQIEYTISLV
jgi:hypothetical protein